MAVSSIQCASAILTEASFSELQSALSPRVVFTCGTASETQRGKNVDGDCGEGAIEMAADCQPESKMSQGIGSPTTRVLVFRLRLSEGDVSPDLLSRRTSIPKSGKKRDGKGN
jgi:hypothetical protein